MAPMPVGSGFGAPRVEPEGQFLMIDAAREMVAPRANSGGATRHALVAPGAAPAVIAAPPPMTATEEELRAAARALCDVATHGNWTVAQRMIDRLNAQLLTTACDLTPEGATEIGAALAETARAAEKADEWSLLAKILSIFALGIPFLVDALTTNEKERLAAAAREAAETMPRALAAALVDATGSADAKDVAAVVERLTQMPRDALVKLRDAGVRVSVCRGSITDAMPELRGVQPRGWPPGATWDIVPGCYSPDTKRIVIATREVQGRRAVPPTGDGHGSIDLLYHETMHAYDAVTDASDEREFRAAREADMRDLSAYERQDGVAGRQETFAETSAAYFVSPSALERRRPSLYRLLQQTFNA